MAKVTPMGLVDSLSGKLCQDSNISFVQRNGRVYTAKKCHPYKGPKTAKQMAVINSFKSAAAGTKSIVAKGAGDPEYDALYAEWQNHKDKYPTFRGYVFAVEYKKE